MWFEETGHGTEKIDFKKMVLYLKTNALLEGGWGVILIEVNE